MEIQEDAYLCLSIFSLDVRGYPFKSYLSVDNVLKVIAALLSERTIVFTSSNYSMPALVMQCLLSYMSPFEWRHSIVPTVPDNFIDILGAPSINILGCHSNWHKSPEFTNIDDAVIVKLDEDVVESKLSSVSLFPELPEADRIRFKTQYQEILVGDYEVDSLERLILPSVIERERRK
uniref:UDENN domain-containing protein n=1 Tax=Amphimedon queenslandica TaxID=400682 RepID=A0A1X7T7K7_AMPQE